MFREKAIAFLNGELVGGPDDLIGWAEQEHQYQDFRPEPLYLTLVEEAYKNHLNGKKVRPSANSHHHKYNESFEYRLVYTPDKAATG